MTNNEYLCVKDFAKITKLTTQSVYQRMQNEELAKYIKVINGRKTIHKSALLDIYGVNLPSKEIVNQYDELINTLKQKDAQIQDLISKLAQQNHYLRELSMKLEKFTENRRKLISHNIISPIRPMKITVNKTNVFIKILRVLF